MQKQFEKYTEVRKRKVDGISPWTCAKGDLAWAIIVKDWENGTRDKILELTKNRNVAIQAGGHQGLYPRLLSEEFSLVYTFEPHPFNFHCLVNNCQKRNIIKIQAALGKTSGLVDNVFDSQNMGMNKVIDGGYIPRLTLDSFAFDAVDLIYLDIEGGETDAIMGAKDLIKKFAPLIVVENATPEVYEFIRELHLYQDQGTIGLDTFFSVG
jgi:FkbM family methyltransferase